MNVEVFIISRYDEKERPYVSTTCPTPKRKRVLEEAGYQVHVATVVVLSCSDDVKRADAVSAAGPL